MEMRGDEMGHAHTGSEHVDMRGGFIHSRVGGNACFYSEICSMLDDLSAYSPVAFEEEGEEGEAQLTNPPCRLPTPLIPLLYINHIVQV